MPASLKDVAARRARWAAFALLVWLALLLLGSGFAGAVLLSVAEGYTDSAAFQIVLCLTGGTLGASMLALLSAGERIARGWSFAEDALARGERRFHARLAPLLALQPILGAAVGMLLLLALSTGSVMLLRLSEGTTFDPMGLLLASTFAGLLARGLLARLRDAADALFGARLTTAASEATAAPASLQAVPLTAVAGAPAAAAGVESPTAPAAMATTSETPVVPAPAVDVQPALIQHADAKQVDVLPACATPMHAPSMAAVPSEVAPASEQPGAAAPVKPPAAQAVALR